MIFQRGLAFMGALCLFGVAGAVIADWLPGQHWRAGAILGIAIFTAAWATEMRK